ncbi:hypothetical protein [uncultured Vibrio sp.]|mgnify:CR=1 FL=1|uniref:hypothetical protein n=1 Tax=uncultured Vibrio sp. TaxID=114054 RepID=UPI0025FB1FFD|nr:hypothetical protein [uncultured Vibrio sp.]
MNKFKFQPRWKEELVVTGDEGQFVLELPMGVLSVYLPTESAWESKSSEWARNQYGELKQELEYWCKENKVTFYIDETADVENEEKWSK